MTTVTNKYWNFGAAAERDHSNFKTRLTQLEVSTAGEEEGTRLHLGAAWRGGDLFIWFTNVLVVLLEIPQTTDESIRSILQSECGTVQHQQIIDKYNTLVSDVL